MTEQLRTAFSQSLKRLYLEGCQDFSYSTCFDKVLRDGTWLLPQLKALILSHIPDTWLEEPMDTAELAEQVGLKVQLVAFGHPMYCDTGFPHTRKILIESYRSEVI